MKRILLVAALGAALGLGSSSFAQSYAGVGFGYMGASGFSFFGQVGDWQALGDNLGLRGRLGLGLGIGWGMSISAEAAVTYNFGRVFSRDLPLILYAVGGPQIGFNFGVAPAPGFLVLGVGAGAGLQYAFTPSISAFWEIQPVGFALWMTTPSFFGFNWGSTLGANFRL